MLSSAFESEGFSPKIFQPTLWLEARRRESLFQTITATTPSVADADVVGTWKDLSLNGNHIAAAANDTTRPTLRNTATFPAVRFDGSNDILKITTTIGLFSSGACSIFAAVKGNTPSISTVLISEGNTSGSTNAFYSLIVDSTTSTSAATFVRNNAGGFQLNSSPIVTGAYSTDSVISMIDSGSSMSLYVDNGAPATASYTRSGVYSFENFSVGGLQRSTPVNFIAADVYGIVIFKGRAVSESERIRMITYMAKLQGRII